MAAKKKGKKKKEGVKIRPLSDGWRLITSSYRPKELAHVLRTVARIIDSALWKQTHLPHVGWSDETGEFIGYSGKGENVIVLNYGLLKDKVAPFAGEDVDILTAVALHEAGHFYLDTIEIAFNNTILGRELGPAVSNVIEDIAIDQSGLVYFKKGIYQEYITRGRSFYRQDGVTLQWDATAGRAENVLKLWTMHEVYDYPLPAVTDEMSSIALVNLIYESTKIREAIKQSDLIAPSLRITEIFEKLLESQPETYPHTKMENPMCGSDENKLLPRSENTKAIQQEVKDLETYSFGFGAQEDLVEQDDTREGRKPKGDPLLTQRLLRILTLYTPQPIPINRQRTGRINLRQAGRVIFNKQDVFQIKDEEDDEATREITLAIVLDGSGSMGKIWRETSYMTETIVSALAHDHRFDVTVTAYCSPQLVIMSTPKFKPPRFVDIPRSSLGGHTPSAQAMEMTAKIAARYGLRPRRLMIHLTDGSTNNRKVGKVLSMLNRREWKVFGIQIDNEFEDEEEFIKTYNGLGHMARNPEELVTVLEKMLKEVK